MAGQHHNRATAADGSTEETTEHQEPTTKLRCENVAVGYPSTDEPVVDCETVTLPAGEITALVGPNGSGKSTLLKTMADHLAPDRGQVFLDGATLDDFDSTELARELGLLSQEHESPGSLTVEDLVYHGRYPHRGFFETVTETDHAAVDRAIDLAGVDHLRETEMGTLSGGQKQLVWISMVLAQDTDVLLLDEPTTFLDLHHQLEVMEIIERLRDDSDMTVLVVLHDLQQAARHADYMVALSDGTIRARGPPDEVVTEDLLASVFEIEARVTSGQQGPEITPLRPLHED